MSGGRRYCKQFHECKQFAAVLIRSTGMPLCKEHFIKNIESRVEKTINKYHMLTNSPPGSAVEPETWVVAMSGGKDSQCLAEILSKLFPKGNSKVVLKGLYIDVHIRGGNYTDDSRALVEKTCARLGMECRVVDIKTEYGITMDDVHVLSCTKHTCHRTECSSCGVIKRYLINKVAGEMGATKVATGHHLTDEATMLLTNFMNVNLEQLTRGQPWERRQVGTGAAGVLIPRVKPFLEISEEETTMYQHIAKLDHVPTQCTYSQGATTSALKKHMIAIEKDRPGTMLRMVRGFHKELYPALVSKGVKPTTSTSSSDPDNAELIPAPEDEPVASSVSPAAAAATSGGDIEEANGAVLNTCSRCGGLTTVPICAYCKLVEQVMEYKKQNPALFADVGGHSCRVCCPPAKDSMAALLASAVPEPSEKPVRPEIQVEGVDGASIKILDSTQSKRQQKKQHWEERERNRRALESTAVASTPADPTVTPAAPAPAPQQQ